MRGSQAHSERIEMEAKIKSMELLRQQELKLSESSADDTKHRIELERDVATLREREVPLFKHITTTIHMC